MPILSRLSMAFILLTVSHTTHLDARVSTHVVQVGQRLASIARRYGLSLDELCSANRLRKNATIRPGQRLSIPVPGSEPTVGGNSDSEKHDSALSARDKNNALPANGTSLRKVSATAAVQYEAPPKRKGLVRIISYHGEWQGRLVDSKNRLVSKSVDSISKILAWPHKDFRMNDRLLMLMAQVSDHFGGRSLRVVSGYRTTSWVEESKHPLGRACDFFVIGVPNKVVRDYLRTLDNTGVGYYPNSTFVHLDVRERNTYWVDYAGPGEPPRLTPTAVIPKDPTSTAQLQTKSAPLDDKTEVSDSDAIAQDKPAPQADDHTGVPLNEATSTH